MRVAIIGAGLAGCALGYVLRQAGLEPVIYEADSEIAFGASGNAVGLYNPRFTAEFGPEAEFYSAAFMRALAVFETLGAIDWNPSGALHLINDEKKTIRFAKTVENWSKPEMRLVSAKEASEIAGVPIEYECLYLPRAGSVSPEKLCKAYVQGVEVHLNSYVPALDLIEADAVVVATGMGTLGFYPMLPLKGVRGQITYVKETEISAQVKTALCYGGYMSASVDGKHCVGSTFQRWLTQSDVIDQDNTDNMAKLAAHIPALSGFEIFGARAAVRTTSLDHFPIIGQMSERHYISTAHGSHGILSSLMGAHILASQLLGEEGPVGDAVIKALSPHRF